MIAPVKKIATGLAAIALLAAGLVASAPATAEDIAVPKQTWPVCDEVRSDFCIESVRVQPLGTSTALDLVYTQTQVPAVASTESSSISSIANRVSGLAVLGSWTHPEWTSRGLNALGYDGLAIDMKTANQFSDNIFFTVLPLMQMIELFFGVAFVFGDGAGSSWFLFVCH
jgi:hypothetical protein